MLLMHRTEDDIEEDMDHNGHVTMTKDFMRGIKKKELTLEVKMSNADLKTALCNIKTIIKGISHTGDAGSGFCISCCWI